MLTTVRVKCVDQALMVNAPRLASGGVNEIRLEVSFCHLWAGMAKTAVFYTDPVKTYHVPMEGDACTIPAEVTDTPGTIYFGFFGVEGETLRTTELAHLSLKQGIHTEGGRPTEPPKQDIYLQILAQMTEARKAAEASAATAEETQKLVDSKLSLEGDLMDGPIDMGGKYKVVGLATPTNAGDAVPLGFAQKNFAPRSYYENRFVYVVPYGLDDLLTTQMEEMTPGELRVVHMTMDEGEVFPGTDGGSSAVCALYLSPESTNQNRSGWADFVVYSADAEPERLYKRLDTNVWGAIKPTDNRVTREFKASPGTASYTTPGGAAKFYNLTLRYDATHHFTFTVDWLGIKALSEINLTGRASYYLPGLGTEEGVSWYMLIAEINADNTVTFSAYEGEIVHIVGYY